MMSSDRAYWETLAQKMLGVADTINEAVAAIQVENSYREPGWRLADTRTRQLDICCEALELIANGDQEARLIARKALEDQADADDTDDAD